MKNYNEMSDFEINKAVAKLYLPCDYEFDDKSEKVDLVGHCTYLGAHGVPDERLEKYGEFDPCNNPSDAWPIITKFKIGVMPAIVRSQRNKGIWIASNDWTGFSELDYRDANPLRAAMICFLKMKDAES